MARENYLDMDFLCAELKREGMSAIVTGSPEGLFHTSGALIITHSPARDRLAFSIVTADGRQALAICQVEESLCAEDSWVGDVRTYVEFQELPTVLLARTLEDLGLNGTIIGIDLGYIRDKFFTELMEAAPSIEFVAADSLLTRLYHRKPAGLIDKMADAAAVAQGVIEKALAGEVVGKTERELRILVRNALASKGADGSYVVVASGPNVAVPEHRATDRVIMAGDVLTIDAAATFDGYVGEIAGSIVVGGNDGSTEVRIAGVYGAAAAALRDGATGGSVFAAAEAAALAAGGRLSSDYIGYGLSFGGRDEPRIARGSESPLEEGMAVTLDIGFALPGEPVLRKKQTWLVGKGGPSLLAKASAAVHPA